MAAIVVMQRLPCCVEEIVHLITLVDIDVYNR